MAYTANSLFKQIQAREAENTTGNKNRKLSLKEKRKLRAEQREMTEFLPKSVEIEEPAPVTKRPDHSSESDVSMRSDVSPKRDSDDVEQLLAANGVTVLEQSGSSRSSRTSNGINLMPGSASLSNKPNSREFAVSRALGKYRQKKKERESSNSDSQDELELGCDLSRNSGIEDTLKSLDAKLAEIEESSEARSDARSMSVTDASKSIPSEKVQNQLNKFEEAGIKPIEVKPARPPGGMTRRVSEDSIDTEDEWYKHEMMRLARLEVEQKSGMMSSVLGELSRKMEEQEATSKEPPDRAEEPPDPRREKKVQRRSSRKQLLRKSTASDTTGDNSGDSSLTGSADDDSETQSGEDEVEDEDEMVKVATSEARSEASRRPENLIIITPQQPQQSTGLNISGLPNKPDLLEELTAAAAEDHYPEHLKHGFYGEDGIWYDEHGDTGYWGEDGEWYDYMDEIGYYSDGGEWHEYDYSTGYWDDDGEWQEKESQKPGKEADHFLWVSEEGTNEYANDQVPSSELTDIVVIGKPASGCTEEVSNIINNNQTNITNITSGTKSKPEEDTLKSLDARSEARSEARSAEPLLHEDEGGGGRWAAAVRLQKFEELRVRDSRHTILFWEGFKNISSVN